MGGKILKTLLGIGETAAPKFLPKFTPPLMLPSGSAQPNLAPKIRPDYGTTFRGDKRPPSVIFNEGFRPRGTSEDLLEHATYGLKKPTKYVSTTKDPKVTKKFGKHKYAIDTSGADNYDVNEILGDKSPYKNQSEIAIKGGVPPEKVKGVTLYPGKWKRAKMSHLNPKYYGKKGSGSTFTGGLFDKLFNPNSSEK